MSVATLPPGPEYREVPGCPGYAAGSDGSLWSNWTAGRWPRRRRGWSRVKGSKTTQSGHIRVVVRTEAGFRVTDFLHRVILTTFVSPCPDGMVCCHDPDPDPANCALANLRWATPTANMEDCKRHGRQAKGGKHPNAKLKDADVPEIFRLRHSGMTQDDIAARFGVRRVVITRILLRQRFAHVPVPELPGEAVKPEKNYARGERHAAAKLTAEAVREMRRLRAEGWLQKALAEKFGVTQWTVCAIVNGKSWSHI